MQIIGNGMVARSLEPYRSHFPDVVAFASGVANSTLKNDEPYQQELDLLRNHLVFCRQHGYRVVYFSSAGAIYGPTEALRDENTPAHPTTRYGQHKLACETAIRNSGARYLIVRLANLVGCAQNPYQLIPALVNQVKTGRVVVQRRAERDIMDVTDFANVLSRMLPVIPDNQVIIVASGISVPVGDLVTAIQATLKVDTVVEFEENGEPQRMSITKLRTLLPDVTFAPDYYHSVIGKYVRLTITHPPATQE